MQSKGVNKMIIVMKNGTTYRWNKTDYTNYSIVGGFFVVIRGEQWVGIYATEDIMVVEVEKDE